jgi:hypothetical protein
MVTPNAYHIVVDLVLKVNHSTTNPPTHEEFLHHLKEYVNDDYIGIELVGTNKINNLSLVDDKLSFDLLVDIAREQYIEDVDDLENQIHRTSLADSAWEGSRSNFFLIIDEKMSERIDEEISTMTDEQMNEYLETHTSERAVVAIGNVTVTEVSM